MGAGHARHGGGRLVVGTAGLLQGGLQLKGGCAHLDSGRVPPVCCPESPGGTTLRPLPNPPAPQCAFSQEFRLCSVSCSSAQGLTLRACRSLGQRGWGHTAHGSTQPSWPARGAGAVFTVAEPGCRCPCQGGPGGAWWAGLLRCSQEPACPAHAGPLSPSCTWWPQAPTGTTCPPHTPRASFLLVGRLLPALRPVPAPWALLAPP